MWLVVLQPDHRTMAAFVLAMIVNNYRTGQVGMCLDLSSLPRSWWGHTWKWYL